MVMRISEGLDGSAVVVRQAWGSFEEVVSRLVERLAGVGRVPSTLIESTIRHVCQREEMASTAMVDIGVSIPHARVEGVNGIQLAIAVSQEAVYEVVVGVPISIVALVLSSPSMAGEHLNYLAALGMLLQSESNRERLRNASSPEEIIRLVREDERLRG